MGNQRGDSKPSEAESRRIRARVLSEWRGVRAERNTSQFEHQLTDLLPGIVRSIGIKDKIDEETITAEWRALVGQFLGTNSRPVRLNNRVLTIAVLDSSLYYVLSQQMKKDLLGKVRERFGTRMVRDLHFTVG